MPEVFGRVRGARSRPRKARLPRVRLGKAEKARVVLRRGPRREKFPPIVRRGTARALVLRGMLLRALRRVKNGGNPAGGFWGGAGRPRALGVRGRGFPRPSAGGSARANGRENLHARAKKTSGNRRGPKRAARQNGARRKAVYSRSLRPHIRKEAGGLPLERILCGGEPRRRKLRDIRQISARDIKPDYRLRRVPESRRPRPVNGVRQAPARGV